MKTAQARGSIFLLRPRQARMVRQVLRLQSEKNKIVVLDSMNLGSYLHLTLRIPSRAAYSAFIRSVSGLIARKALKTERGPAALKKTRKEKRQRRETIFWEFRPLTQILDAALFSPSVFRRWKRERGLARVLSRDLFASFRFSSA